MEEESGVVLSLAHMVNKHRFFSYGYQYFLLFIFLQAQYVIAQPGHVSFKKLSVGEGLSNSSVYALLQDSLGFLWIGTYDGLNIYNGYEVKMQEFNKTSRLTASWEKVSCFDTDSHGNVWFGVQYAGISCYQIEEGTYQNYFIDSLETIANPKNNVWAILVDKSDNVWVGTGGKGLFLFNPKERKFKDVNATLGYTEHDCCNFITSIVEDSHGNIWVGTSDSGVRIINPETWESKVFDLPSADNTTVDAINALYQDTQHRIWIGTRSNGMYVYQEKEGLIQSFSQISGELALQTANVRCFLEDTKGNFWIGTDGDGLFIYNQENKELVNYRNNTNDPQSLSSNVVFSMIQTRDEVIWIGTNKGGINSYDAKRDKFSNTVDGTLPGNLHLSYKVLLSVMEDKDSNLWFGTDGGGIDRYMQETNSLKSYRNQPDDAHSLSGNAVKTIFSDSRSRIWVGTYGHGLNQYQPATDNFQRIPVAANITAKDIWDMSEDDEGNLWVATLNEGLFVIRNNSGMLEKYTEAPESESVIGSHLFTLRWDNSQKGLWIGTNKGLRFLLPKKGRVKGWDYNPEDSTSLGCYIVKVIFIDSHKQLWLGMQQGGLSLFDQVRGTFKTFTMNQGLSSNTIASIAEDANERLWIGTSNGLNVFNPQTGDITSFSQSDGLQNIEFVNNSVCRLHFGSFIFGGSNGYDKVDPARIEKNTYLPEIYITRLVINNRDVVPQMDKYPLDKNLNVEDEIVLHHSQKTVSLYLSAISYTHSEKNIYAYKMEELDTAWYTIGNQRMVTFTNLAPQTYHFWYNASNNDGVWNEHPKVLTIKVLPPWWRTVWAQTLWFLMVASLIYGWMRYRDRLIRRQKKELENLVRQRTHELLSEKEKVEQQNIELTNRQNEILKQNEEITAMSQKLHQADEEKLEFFTTISHEIRTPLTLILGPLEQALSVNKNSLLQKQLLRVKQNAETLKRLVTQILDFRKADSSNQLLQAAEYDLVALMHEISASFFDIARKSHIKYRINAVDASLPVWVDYDKFFKIITNLLSNAFKFTPQGGLVEVHISRQKADDAFPDGAVVLKVQDSGIGISPEQQDKIFTRFYQANTNAQQGRTGTGIGLALVKKLTERHYGTIAVESTIQKGTTFVLHLPLGNAHLQKEEMVESRVEIPVTGFPAREEEEPAAQLPEKDRPVLLVIEDNPDLRSYLHESLQHQYRILEASDGKEGLTMARRESPAFIISDIMMPEMDGIEVCKQLKSNIATSHIPIILLTAMSHEESKLSALEWGADDYIIKPFNLQEVRLKIRNILHARELLHEKISRQLIIKPRELTLPSPDELFLEHLLEVMEKHISDSEFTIDQLCLELGISRSLLYTKIKNYTNLSVNEFIKSFRLKRAAQLLTQGALTVSEISDLVGFANPSHFGKCFKKEFGVSAGSYKTTGAAN